MECNKDEAVRAKTIAEKKFADRDIAGAKKLALKARTLDPGLDGISDMLNAFDVCICYEKKVNGESDWYGILDANPSDDDETIKKQYKKLLRKIHPDKNRSVGAHDACKILLEAWTLLSDKSKRAAYDLKRNPKVSSQKERPSADRSPEDKMLVPMYTIPFIQLIGSWAASLSGSNNNTHAEFGGHPSTTPHPALAPFWTSCVLCMMSFQYPRIHVNKTILCLVCHKPFIAADLNIPFPGCTSICWPVI
ncbi:DnaJ domain-containing protein [Artemisia annua]|uniref:DnaJ domain-containing protein n=1 Tax=Artemisia annua TaxID=35608 RepID=A0A2U1KGC1_ARTAN|nr:DnaJ domain-containing protein [Artemisia annua]